MRFENLNSSRFSQILTEINSSDLKSHIHIMLQPRVWGTVEIIVASTYFQVLIYFFRTPSSMLKWEVFNPLGPSCEFSYQEYPEVDTAAEDMTFLDHFELLFKDDSHYDSITLKSGEVSLVRPTLQYSYTDCRNYIILFCCCVCFFLHFVLSYVVCML